MTKIYPLIYLNNHIYAVDKEAIKAERDRVYNHVTKDPEEVFLSGSQLNHWKLIATTNPSLNLPLLPEVKENIGKLASSAAFHDTSILNKYEQQGYIRGWELGYKAASAKKYTEEDMRRAIKRAKEYHNNNLNKLKYSEDEIIQSLTPRPISVELEMDEETYLIENPAFSAPYVEEIKIKVDKDNFVNVIKWNYE